MNNREAFEASCELLPDGVTWGDPITPSIVKHIAALASQAQQCSSLCHKDEPCSITASGKCDAMPPAPEGDKP